MTRSDQEIFSDQPVGAQGFPIDSLGLIEFVAALEKSFGVEIPDSIWKAGGRLTPSDFVNLIIERSPQAAGKEDTSRLAPRPRLAANASYPERIRSAIRQQGVPAASRWLLQRLWRRLARSIHAREGRVILRHDLDQLPDHAAMARADLRFGEVTRADRAALESLWAPHFRSKELRVFDERLDSGTVGLGAWNGPEIVGIDYLASFYGKDSETGLEMKLLPETCFALGLYEKYAGEGIGSTLLGFSLLETKRRGFKRQVTIVNEENVKMLISAVQLFGFQEIGRIRSRRALGRVRSEWFIGDQPQQGRTVEI